MLYTIRLQKVAKFAANKPRAVVGNKLVWKAMAHENRLEKIDDLFRSHAVHWNDVGPFGVGIAQKQAHRSEGRSSEIQVDSLPGMSRPFPRVKRCGSRLFLLQLAAGASVHSLLDVLVDSWPPDITSGHQT